MQIVERHLNTLPKFPDRMFGRPLASFNDDGSLEILKSLNWLLFADSILLTLPVIKTDKMGTLSEPAAAAAHRRSQNGAGLFLFTVTRLMLEMFTNGLPLRGAVHAGEFYVEPPFFAGATITEAYELAATQNWTGCVLTTAARQQIEELYKGDKLFGIDHALPVYDVPSKAGSIQCRSINWGFFAPWNYPFVEGSLREAVLDSFQKHNKTVGEKEFSKINNTEAFLSFCRLSARSLHSGPWSPLPEFAAEKS